MFTEVIYGQTGYNARVEVAYGDFIRLDQGMPVGDYPVNEAKGLVKALKRAIKSVENESLFDKLARVEVGQIIRWNNDSIWFRGSGGWYGKDGSQRYYFTGWDGVYTFEVID